MKPTVIFRCDGGTHIGMGHVVRCLALAHMLREYFDIQFVLQETDDTVYKWITAQGFSYKSIGRTSDFQADGRQLIHTLQANGMVNCLVVLDGYNFMTPYQQMIQAEGHKVVAIDDLHQWYHSAEAVINHAPGISNSGYECHERTRLLLGLDYALLRPEFLHATRTERTIKKAENFLISMGASDENNRTEFFARMLIDHFPQAQIRLLMSTLNPHYPTIKTWAESIPQLSICINLNTQELIEVLIAADVVICPASTISIEACAIGCSLITGYTASNQMGILAGLIQNGAAHSLGDLNKLNNQEALTSIQLFSENLSARETQLLHQRTLLDGNSDRRLALAFLEIQYNCTVRRAIPDDALLYFQWANDPEVRANSYQTGEIRWGDHLKWFDSVITSDSWHLWLYCINDTAAAQMRLKIENNTATINYSVSEPFRGKKLSKLLLQHAALNMSLQDPRIEYIEGWVKKSNIPSCRAFKSSGYLEAEETADSILFRKSVNR